MSVECQACAIALSEARAENAVEAAPRFDGRVLCGGCRDAFVARRELAGLRAVIASVADDLEADGQTGMADTLRGILEEGQS